jgi:ADP-ribose pyrophosphatase
MPPLPWKTLSSRIAYENPWIRVREDVAEMPNGKTTLYGVIECAGAVGVLPFVGEDHVVLVRQYRYVFGEAHRWEMPTGGVKAGEALTEAAQRELREEIGYEAGELVHVNTHYTSKSVMREVADLYLGYDLRRVTGPPDETEFLEVGTFTFDEVLRMVHEGEVRDAMTIMAVLLAASWRR